MTIRNQPASTLPGEIKQFQAGRVPAGWTQFAGPAPSYSGYLPYCVFPGRGIAATETVFQRGSFGLFSLSYASTTYTLQLFNEATGAWDTKTGPGVSANASVSMGAFVAFSSTKFLLASISAGSGTTTARIYDSETNTWAAAANMPSTSRGGGGCLLANGLVYICGDGATGYLYNPATNVWATAAKCPLQSSWSERTYVLLSNGKLLTTTGSQYALYTPATDSWETLAIPNAWSISQHVAALSLDDGRVYYPVGGGATVQSLGFIYDPLTNTWSQGTEPTYGASGSNAGQLSDGTWVFQSGNAVLLHRMAGVLPAAVVSAIKD